jgi:16S rRNA (guanine1516-N2)-methyltransferase
MPSNLVVFRRDGDTVIPPETEELRHLKLSLIFEWQDGQYWLHSDDPKERPIGIEIDEILERHVAYFKNSSVYKEILAKAVGIKTGLRPRILDLTGGLLGDSLLLLAMGCEVMAVERHPAVAFLVKSALENATHPLLSRFKFFYGDASTLLEKRPQTEVIFFDPMFEDANQKSLPKKEMRIFRSMIGEDTDAAEVFKRALEIRPTRLVIKRPRLSMALGVETPLQYVGKATRYDVYLGLGGGPIVSNLLK